MGRCSGTRARDHARWSERAEPAGAFGGRRHRRAHRVGRRVWLCRSREASARHAESSIQDRNGVHSAHVGRGRPAAGGRPVEAGRRDSDVRPRVPEETVAGHSATVDGASGRRQDRRRRRGTATFSALRAAGRRVAILCRERAAVRAGHPVSLFELRLDRGERGGRGCRGRGLPHVHAGAGLRASRDGRHTSRLHDEGDPGPGDPVLPKVCSRPPLRPGRDARD